MHSVNVNVCMTKRTNIDIDFEEKKNSVNENVPVITINVAIIVICWFQLVCLFDLSPCLSVSFPSHFHVFQFTLINVTDMSVSHFGADLCLTQQLALLTHSYCLFASFFYTLCS